MTRAVRHGAGVVTLALLLTACPSDTSPRSDEPSTPAVVRYEPARAGAVRVSAERITATGRVVTNNGAPIAGAKVSLALEESSEGGAQCPIEGVEVLGRFFEAFGDALTGLFAGILGAKPSERRTLCGGGVSTRTDDDGRFRLALPDVVATRYLRVVATKGDRIVSLTTRRKDGRLVLLELMNFEPTIRLRPTPEPIIYEEPPWAHSAHVQIRQDREITFDGSADDPIDRRLLEDFGATASFSITTGAGDGVGSITIAQRNVPVTGARVTPPSRGLPCTLFHRGGTTTVPACPLTDGDVDTTFLSTDRTCCPERTSRVRLDLGGRRSIAGIALRGCSFCDVRASANGRKWHRINMGVGFGPRLAGFEERPTYETSRFEPAALPRVRFIEVTRAPEEAAELSLWW